jgi:hypothetical protein
MGLENPLSLSNLESAWDRKKARSLGSSSMPSQESNLRLSYTAIYKNMKLQSNFQGINGVYF